MSTFYYKARDAEPIVDFVLQEQDASGEPVLTDVDLTGASVMFYFRPQSGGDAEAYAGEVLSNEDKIVRCQLPATAFPGVTDKTLYDFEIIVTFPDGDELTFPTNGYERAVIYPRLIDIPAVDDEDAVYPGPRLDLSLWLQGPYRLVLGAEGGGMMFASLASQGRLPYRQPYGSIAGSDKTYEGAEFTTPTVLSGLGNVIDWIVVELRLTTTMRVYRKAALLCSDGSVVNPDGTPLTMAVPDGSYYVVVRHRNHVSAMSAQPVVLSREAVAECSFKGGASYGADSQRTLGGGVYALYAGDWNGNDSVDAEDDAVFLALVGQAGYLAADGTLNGQVQTSDNALRWGNDGIVTRVPSAT